MKANQNMLHIYRCEKCDYECSKNYCWKQHLTTAKHLKANKMLIEANKKYACEKCLAQFTHQSSFCRHKKKCNNSLLKKNMLENMPNNDEFNHDISDKDLLMMIVKQNSELINVIKNVNHNTVKNSNNNNISNNNNKTFNLQFFLNETCKDAINISDFVSSIKPQLADLEATGRMGYVEGVSNIILNNLNTMDTHERPIHCSDQKREILYIKDNDKWTKEEEDKPILTKAIKTIANENIKNIYKWRQENPDCTDSDSKKNNTYLKIVSNAMSGSTVEESNKNINKIISNVAKKVLINKNKIETN